MLRSNFGRHYNLAAADDVVIKIGNGVLVSVTINTPVAEGTLTIYDGIDDQGTLIASVVLPATLLGDTYVLPYMCQFTNGLYIEMVEDMNITVVYS